MKRQNQEPPPYNPYKAYEDEIGLVRNIPSDTEDTRIKPGLTLSESSLLNRVAFNDENFTLVNKYIYQTQIDDFQNHALLPNQIVYCLREYFIMKMKEGKLIIENRFPLNCLVIGHAITLLGFDIELSCFTFIDTINPSVLSFGQNNFGVSAIESKPNNRIWLLSGEDLEKVIMAVFIPTKDWESLIEYLKT